MFLLLVTVLSYVESWKSNDKLIVANILYRHGLRSPVVTYPTDPNNVKWLDGFGQLTQKGMLLEYDLGKFLKDRYVATKFINVSYLHQEVSIRSSGVGRCLQSAELQLAGLYPPQGRQVWNKDIKWQPIPVQTVPTDQDPLLRPDSTDCPRLKELVKTKLESDEYKQKEKDSEELLNYISQHSGLKATFDNSWYISDPTYSELAEGLPMVPVPWVMKRWDDIKNLNLWIFTYRYYGDAIIGKLLGGALLGEMENNMDNFISGKKTEKLNIYSGHDTSILSLSSALDIRINEKIPFAACVLVELYMNEQGAYYVQISYRNDSDHIVPWKLKDCDEKCPLDDFKRITSERIPTDRHADCQLSPTSINQRFLALISLHRWRIATTYFMVQSVVFLCIIVWCWCKRKNSYSKPYLHDSDDPFDEVEKVELISPTSKPM